MAVARLGVYNNALRTGLQPFSPDDLRKDPARRGHAVESAVGAQLMSSIRRTDIDMPYWNIGSKEVDYVLRRDGEIVAIEVKSADTDSISGMRDFLRKHPCVKPYLIGGQGMPLETTFTMSAADLF